MRTQDPVGTALASIGAGATAGAACMTAGVLVLRLLQQGDAERLSPDAGGMILSVSVSIGLFAAIAAGWTLTRTIDDLWRRGVTAGMAVFGTVLLTLPAAPLDAVLGAGGLAVYLIILVAAMARLIRAARSAGSA